MNEFRGQGIQSSGPFTVGRDIHITAGPRDNATLLKVRSTDPRDDKVRIEQQKGGLLRASYEWILSYEDFLRWRDGEGYQLLWIRGDPGKGKTMLVCGIINELNEARKSGCNIAYFFCQATNFQLRKATFVLQGLIFSLISQQPDLLDLVRDDIDQASSELFRDLNGWAALCRIFNLLIEETERRRQITYILVDALDECLEDRSQLIKWIASLSSSGIRILISSRNWPLIESGLSNATQKVALHLELNDEAISNAVDRYIDDKVVRLERSKDLDIETRETVKRHLKSYSSNTFLWVALVCEILDREDTYPWRVLDMLHEFPPGLNELYGQMATHCFASKEAELCRRVLAVQTLAYRPLTLTELLSLVKCPEMIAERWLRKIIELCGSFLTVKEDTIYFVHQSAKDYLTKNMPDSLFPEGILASGHRAIVVQSIQALAGTLRENMYQLPSIGFRLDNVNAPNPDPLRGIRYACVYWADHLVDAELMKKRNAEDGRLVYQFLEQHLLHWFEALSLLRQLRSGIAALTKILSPQQTSSGIFQDLSDMVYDAWRFIHHNRVGIESAPLQVYSSALIFSPTCSLVRRLFLKEPEWLLMSPTAESHWSPCLQTLEGHTSPISSLAFAPNGKYVASASDDCTIRFWDVTTGECLNILGDHEKRIGLIVFSPNGELLASSSISNEICIWDTLTGAWQRTLTCDPNEPRSWLTKIAFRDDENVISIDNCAAVCIWDIATGECVKRRPREVVHVKTNTQISLSGNGRRAAWLTADRKKGKIRVNILDTRTRQRHKTPWYPRLGAVALSFDGEAVAYYLTESEELCIWDIRGDRSWAIKLPTDYPDGQPSESLTWSPDGQYIAARGDKHKTIIVKWAIATGPAIIPSQWTGVIQYWDVLEFSPDSTLLVSSSLNKAVQVFEMAALRTQPEKRKWPQTTNYPTKPFLSPDGNFLGFTGDDGDIQVWDLVKNRRLSRIAMPYDWGGPWDTMTFSPDGKQLLRGKSSPAGGHVKHVTELFDAATGCRLWEICESGRNPHSVAFSENGTYLVSDTRARQHGNRAVSIRDAITGTCIGVITIPSRETWALSNDGTKLATTRRTVSPDRIRKEPLLRVAVCIFDVATGSYRCLDTIPNAESCYTLMFSPDDSHIVLLLQGEIWIVEATTGALLKRLVGFEWVSRWVVAGLQTSRGIYDTRAPLDDPRDLIEYDKNNVIEGTLSGVGISPAGDWILKNGEPYLWIPQDHRHTTRYPRQDAIAGNTIVIGDASDQIYCIRL
ncbi:hypothetical protein F5B22DRAFT_89894 [Xylaria bambusicola]|uniref:uncharacterized protein n=1 Tax=Xylaria bambusicola TaxID=326684 RepID=UPI0020080245|nr:uncharacterized protein F5B22DRAFT_89894 [Xylaria bambusicola]KAI0518055.1 hypothetical protein F5B22DRAFT_89894 [Xylaria bambusicola]